MRYYRCKCGERTAWSSMGVYQCERCSKCGSDLAEAPSLHREPKPHQMLASPVEAETDAGKQNVGTLSTCIWCHATLAEIEKRGEPHEPWSNT